MERSGLDERLAVAAPGFDRRPLGRQGRVAHRNHMGEPGVSLQCDGRFLDGAFVELLAPHSIEQLVDAGGDLVDLAGFERRLQPFPERGFE